MHYFYGPIILACAFLVTKGHKTYFHDHYCDQTYEGTIQRIKLLEAKAQEITAQLASLPPLPETEPPLLKTPRSALLASTKARNEYFGLKETRERLSAYYREIIHELDKARRFLAKLLATH